MSEELLGKLDLHTSNCNYCMNQQSIKSFAV